MARARRATRRSSIQRGFVHATHHPLDDASRQIVGDAQLAGLTSGDLFVQRARVACRLSRRQRQRPALRRRAARRALPGRRQWPRSRPRRSAPPCRARSTISASASPSPPDRPRRAALDAAPATIALEQGRVRLAGRWGDGLVIQSRLDSLDLSMLNAFSPGLGLGGRATGSLDFAQPPAAASRAPRRGSTSPASPAPASPSARRRSTSFSPAALRPEGGAGGAIIRRGGAIIGRAAGAAAAARARRRAPGRPGCSRRRSPAASAITARPTCRCPSPTCPATS